MCSRVTDDDDSEWEWFDWQVYRSWDEVAELVRDQEPEEEEEEGE